MSGAGGGRAGRNAGLEAVGIVTRCPDADSLEAARRGGSEGVAAGVRCGECDAEWDATLAPTGKRACVCPRCGALNRIFSQWPVG